MKKIQIGLPQSTIHYSVLIGSGILKDSLRNVLAEYEEKKVYVITNDTLTDFYPDYPDCCLPSDINIEKLILPDGEEHKNLDTLSRIFDFLLNKKANRKSILIAFGGGVIGDMTGFAAATFMRGVRYIQVPTTLLSQVDSSVGGKTGVNHPAGKNMIGAFKQPFQAILDIDFLNTLPQKQFISGYAELVKHGFIKDRALFDLLESHSPIEIREDSNLMVEAVYRSCLVKAGVVEEDEKEAGVRAILNFGHTIGHFLETLTGYRQMLHGEAVIIGMDFAAWWSVQQGVLSQNEYELIHNHLAKLEICQYIPEVSESDFIKIVERDKKAASDGVRFIGLEALGKARIFEQIGADTLWERYREYLEKSPFLIQEPE